MAIQSKNGLCFMSLSLDTTVIHQVYGLPFPLMITSCHGFCTAILAFGARHLVARGPNESVPSISYQDWFYRISPAGTMLASSRLPGGFTMQCPRHHLSHGHWPLQPQLRDCHHHTVRNPASLAPESLCSSWLPSYTMVKSTVVVWTLISAFIFGLEKPVRLLLGSCPEADTQQPLCLDASVDHGDCIHCTRAGLVSRQGRLFCQFHWLLPGAACDQGKDKWLHDGVACRCWQRP